MVKTREGRTAGAYGFGAFTLDKGDERLIGPDGPVPIGRKAYGVLAALLDNSGRLVTKDMLFETVWAGTIVSDYALTSVIKELRKGLGEKQGRNGLIETVYGRGYRFNGTVSEINLPPAKRLFGATSGVSLSPQGEDQTRSVVPTGQPPLLIVPHFNDNALGEAMGSFAPVMREEILFALSRFRDIRLLSDTGNHSIEKGVFGLRDYCLDVILTPGARGAKVFSRIKRLNDDSILWSDFFDANLDDMHMAIKELVQRIIGAMIPQVASDLLNRAPNQPADLYDRYFQQAQKHRNPLNTRDVTATIKAWTQMVEEHPRFLPPYLKLIRLLNVDGGFVTHGFSGPEQRATARRLVRTAIDLDPMESHVHVLMGWCCLWHQETRKASRHFDEAARLNPYNPKRLSEAATGKLYIGDLDGATMMLETTLEMTSFTSDPLLEDYGLLHLLRGEFDQAENSLSLGERPSIAAQLFRLINAEANGDGSVSRLAGDWIATVGKGWHNGSKPGRGELLKWIGSMHPFQQRERQEEILSLASKALAKAP